MNKLLIVGFFLLSLIPGKTQAQITGHIFDETHKVVPGVNVIVLKAHDSTLVKAVVTDEKGSYAADLQQTGTFRIMVSLMGYSRTYTDTFVISSIHTPYAMNDIQLTPIAANLKGVEVVSNKPFIELRPDRIIVNVQNSIVSTGNNVLEILKRSPNVSVDKDGNIGVKGKQGTLVMIDHKPTYLSAEELADLLKTIDASQVDKIEVITNPSSKYDAAGNAGIVDIVLKKGQLTGLNAQVNASLGKAFTDPVKGDYITGSAGFNMNYKQGRWNFFGSYNYRNDKTFWHGEITQYFSSHDSLESVYHSTLLNMPHTAAHTVRVGADLRLTSRQTLGVTVNTVFSNVNTGTSNNFEINDHRDVLNNGLSTTGDGRNKKQNLTINGNYLYQIDSVGNELQVNVDYGLFSRRNKIFYTDVYFDNQKEPTGKVDYLQSNLPTDIHIESAKIDFTHPVNSKTKLTMGVKFSNVDNNNDFLYWTDTSGTYVVDHSKTNSFKYTENINAAYVNLDKVFNDHFNVQLGVRAEQTNGSGTQKLIDSTFHKHYLNLFPNASLNWKVNNDNSLTLAYNSRIDRPNYQDMNPYLFYFNPYYYYRGNPYLKPQLTSAVTLTHSYKEWLSTSLSYSRTKDVISQIAEQDTATHILYYTNRNISVYDNYSLVVVVTLPVTKWWNTTNTITGYYDYLKSALNSGQFKNDNWGYMLNTQNDFTLHAGWSAEISAWYNSTAIYGITTVQPVGSISVGVKKDVLKKQGSIKFSMGDVFWSEKYKEKALFMDTNVQLNSYMPSRKANLSFSYKFGKSKTHHVDNGGVSEEMNRIQK